MKAKGTHVVVHIYSKDDKEVEYDGFRIFPEKADAKPAVVDPAIQDPTDAWLVSIVSNAILLLVA